jgi:hypothetical protein
MDELCIWKDLLEKTDPRPACDLDEQTVSPSRKHLAQCLPNDLGASWDNVLAEQIPAGFAETMAEVFPKPVRLDGIDQLP